MLHTVTDKDLPVLLSALAHALSSQQCPQEPWDARERADLVALLHALSTELQMSHGKARDVDQRAADLSWAVHRAVCGSAQAKDQAAHATDEGGSVQDRWQVAPEGYIEVGKAPAGAWFDSEVQFDSGEHDDLFRPRR